MRADGRFLDYTGSGDFAVGHAARDELENFALAHCQLIQPGFIREIGRALLGDTIDHAPCDRRRQQRPAAVRRIVVVEGIFLALASCLVAALPAVVLTAVLDNGLGNLFMNAALPFRVSLLAAVIWVVLAILGSVLATDAAATRASRITVREALAYL